MLHYLNGAQILAKQRDYPSKIAIKYTTYAWREQSSKIGFTLGFTIKLNNLNEVLTNLKK